MDFIDQNAGHYTIRCGGFAGWPGTKAKFGAQDGSDEGTVVEVKIITTKVVSDSEAERRQTAKARLSSRNSRVPCGGATGRSVGASAAWKRRESGRLRQRHEREHIDCRLLRRRRVMNAFSTSKTLFRSYI